MFFTLKNIVERKLHCTPSARRLDEKLADGRSKETRRKKGRIKSKKSRKEKETSVCAKSTPFYPPLLK